MAGNLPCMESLYFPELEISTELRAIVRAWGVFFEKHRQVFIEDQWSLLQCGDVDLDFNHVATRGPPPSADAFRQSLEEAPAPTLAVLAAAVHLLVEARSKEAQPHLVGDLEAASQQTADETATSARNPFKIHVHVYNYSPLLPLHCIRSSTVGRFVALRGAVAKVHAIRPLVLSMDFVCVKCGTCIIQNFKEGRYSPPALCTTANCRSRGFAPQRRSAVTIDSQRIRIQSLSSETQQQTAVDSESLDEGHNVSTGDVPGAAAATAASRRALHVECELLRSLVDLCIPGDVVTICGIVKATPTGVGKTGLPPGAIDGRSISKSLFALYVEAVSVISSTSRRPFKNLPLGANRGCDSTGMAGGSFGGSQSTLCRDFEKENAIRRAKAGGLAVAIGQRLPAVVDVDALDFYGDAVDVDAANGSGEFTEKEVAFIHAITHEEKMKFELLVASMCPSIFGLETVKMGLALALLGGVPLLSDDKTEVRRRGNIHCVLVGDPGMGKSKLLRAITSLAERSVYVCGNTSSTTGLTAAVVREQGSGDFALEAGALVLSDGGVCCIDELDKMPTSEQQAFLEAMEQQTVSVAKAGIVCTLCARSTVIAAANPADGKYQPRKTVTENLKMPPPLLSRFDLIFILRDEPDAQDDGRLSRHILQLRGAAVSSSTRGGGGGIGGRAGKMELGHDNSLLGRIQSIAQCRELLPPSLVKTYIRHAKAHVNPTLTPEAATIVKTFYVELRQRSQGSLTVTTRQLEAIIRLCQARARADLAKTVTPQHVRDVIEIYSASAVCEEQDGFATHMRTATGKRCSGKSVTALLIPFRSALARLARQRADPLLPRAEVQKCAAQIVQIAGSQIDPCMLVDTANAEGLILRDSECWKFMY